jgi:aspartyl-tRNA(Asn)/glutamyl-tRNA(Gln) amidotransferase subunit C
MPLTRDEVEHVARLANIGLEDDEIARVTSELASVLAHFAKIQEIDTSGVTPTTQALEAENVWREDVVRPSLPVELVVKNAPRLVNDLFEVPAILD